MRTVYCDEAGFTGNHLLDEEQPYFAYAALELTPEEAKEYTQAFLLKLGGNTKELKGSRLCRSRAGKKIAREIIKELAPRSCVAVFNKKYSLACKMFEYLIEPVVSHASSLLYDLHFHRFVANLAYSQMLTDGLSSDSVFRRFQSALSGRTDGQLLAIGAESSVQPMSDFIDHIVTFAMCNRSYIADEVVDLSPGRAGGWMLELSTTGLFSVLRKLGEDMQPMEVFCDDSKPLQDSKGFINAMVGRTDKRSVIHGGREHQLTYNLSSPIKMVNSVQTPGVQLADALASVSAYALKYPDDDLSKFWWEQNDDFIHEDSVFPQPEYVDYDDPRTQVNHMVFQGLLHCSLMKESCTSKLPEIVDIAKLAVSSPSNPFYLENGEHEEQSY